MKSLAVGRWLFVLNEEVGMEGDVNGRDASFFIRRRESEKRRLMIPMDSFSPLPLRRTMEKPTWQPVERILR